MDELQADDGGGRKGVRGACSKREAQEKLNGETHHDNTRYMHFESNPFPR
jgi:hypothetical protein